MPGDSRLATDTRTGLHAHVHMQIHTQASMHKHNSNHTQPHTLARKHARVNTQSCIYVYTCPKILNTVARALTCVLQARLFDLKQESIQCKSVK